MTTLQPDTPHRFVLAPGGPGVTQVRLDVYPDGGMARLRLWGRPTVEGRKQLGRNWFDALLPAQAVIVLQAAGASGGDARAAVDARPLLGSMIPIPTGAISQLLDGT